MAHGRGNKASPEHALKLRPGYKASPFLAGICTSNKYKLFDAKDKHSLCEYLLIGTRSNLHTYVKL